MMGDTGGAGNCRDAACCVRSGAGGAGGTGGTGVRTQHAASLRDRDLHIDTLYICDADGRLRAVREPGAPDAPPRFTMVRAPGGNSWRFRHDVPAALIAVLDPLCHAEPVGNPGVAEPRIAVQLRALLATHAPLTDEYRGPAYWIPTLPPFANTLNPSAITAPLARSGSRVGGEGLHGAVIVAPAQASVLDAHFPWRAHLLRSGIDAGPLAAVLIDGAAVAVCSCARLSAAAAEAGVDTIESVRGHGYASAAVACWAAAVRARGLLPMYSTSWDNLASQGVARRLAMVCYGEDWAIG